MRYAYFPQNRRLAVELRGVVTIYDTAEYQFRGMLQAHSAETVGASILTQRGRVRLTDLVTVSVPAPLSEQGGLPALGHAMLGRLPRRPYPPPHGADFSTLPRP
jgi:hypothetical protein